jgi:ABC-type branched-subunit amino acid transport system substrate-binding protein
MASSTIFQINPYIIGRPIHVHEPELFIGRKGVFQFIEENLKQGNQVILLPGERRIGKSSLLKQIPNFVTLTDFVFVPFDLEYHNPEPLSTVLQYLATEITDYCNQNLNQVTPPTTQELENNLDIFTDKFLPQIYQALGGKKLVLLLDEFDSFTTGNSQSAVKKFFPYLKSIIGSQLGLFIIIGLGRNASDLTKLQKLFKEPPYYKIGLLDDADGKTLITQPAQGRLKYSEDALQAILELSGGHPYFIQIICFTIFGHARNQEEWNVTRKDVESIINKAIESAEGGFSWLWDGLSIPERVMFSAIAETQKEQTPEEPFQLLKNHGIERTKSLNKAKKQLANRGFFNEKTSQVKIELLRLWVLQQHPVHKQIGDLEKVEQKKVKSIHAEATRLYQEDNKQAALTLYTQILDFNPNDFGSLLALADGDLEDENFDKALERYTRAYQVDPLRNKEKLLQAREIYAKKLVDAGDLEGAKQQYEEVLNIEPERLSTRQKLKVVEALLIDNVHNTVPTVSPSFSLPEPIPPSPPPPIQFISSPLRLLIQSPPLARSIFYKPNKILLSDKRLFIFIIISAILGISTISLAISRVSTRCPAGEKKELGLICVANLTKITRGEITLFPTISNTNRDKGIEAYKQGNYADAVNLFRDAVKDAKNDPEVLIYCNNALARSKGSPITLAVVVPVDNNSTGKAQEILRGVAQAQNQFNQKNGLNGRLLEIAIAKDGTKEKDPQFATSQQVVQELLKHEDILGVIGNNSSDTTQDALSAYENTKMPVISSTSTSISQSSKFFFRTVPSDAASGRKLAEYAIKSGLKKTVIFSKKDSTYSSSLSKEFTDNFERLGGEVVGNQTLDSEEVIPVSKYQAQAVVLFPDAAQISQAVGIARLTINPQNQQQPGIKLLGGDTLYSQEILNKEEDRKAVEGLVLVVPWFRDEAPAKNFAKSAQQQWGAPVSWRTATSYDATQAFIKAIQNTSTNLSRETVLQALRQVNLSPNETSGGNLQFTPDGERQSEPVLVQVKDGKFTTVP